MNYIKRLERQVQLMADEIVRRENQRVELIQHLRSPKFSQVPYINTQDVLERLGAGFGSQGSFEGTPEQVEQVKAEHTP